jgi:maltooligosyltrehalose trehalohydrolase
MLVPQRQPMSFGAKLVGEMVLFRLWAPDLKQVFIILDSSSSQSMQPLGEGWYEFLSAEAKAGTRYKFRLNDGTEVPDPASRYQPNDVHGSSEVIDPTSFEWSDAAWIGRPWEECVLYELHIGAFTQEGTFASAMARLEWLANIGVTAVEIMPVADFPGKRNWGYDGVLLYAPDSTYGRPDDLKALIDAAHRLGIMVFLDVVYNHFGPDGNYLGSYAPIFTERHTTPWGAAVNYDAVGSHVIREFVIQNALYWIEEFHFDGLRLDAVHAIKDDSKLHLLEEMAARLRKASAGRHIHLLLENEENQASLIERSEHGAPMHYTAQWNDDVHHVLHAAATGEATGYYGDYAGDTEKLGRALAEGFAFQGDLMKYRGTTRGSPSGHLPPTAFVGFIQNHDQIGNRAFGDRLTSLVPDHIVRALVGVYLLLPQIPMIFMGEEFGASTPFPFFCDFGAELAAAVREGRRAEFAKFPEFQDPHKCDLIPDPTLEQTFRSAKLDWGEIHESRHAAWADLYRDLLAVRHREIVPRLRDIRGNSGRYTILAPGAVWIDWVLGDGSNLRLIANLSDRILPIATLSIGRPIWTDAPKGEATPSDATASAWSVRWTIQEPPT